MPMVTEGEEKILNVLRALEARFEAMDERLERLEEKLHVVLAYIEALQAEADAEIPF